jgi:hypothetical protein
MIFKRFLVPLGIALAFAAGSIVLPLHHARASAQSTSVWREYFDGEKPCHNHGGAIAFSYGGVVLCHDGTMWVNIK